MKCVLNGKLESVDNLCLWKAFEGLGQDLGTCEEDLGKM